MTDYKLVPVEPTTEMESEGMLSLCGSIGGYESGLAQKCWHAMLAAAPAVQGEPEIIERLASAERRCSEAISEAYKLRRLWEFAASMIAFNSKKITPRGGDEKRLIELAKGTDHGMAWSGTTDGWITESMACSIAVTQPAEQQPELAKYQPCGCVICTCEHETQCQGCGANHCGTHPVGQFSGPVYQQPAPAVPGTPVAVVDANDDDMWADILPPKESWWVGYRAGKGLPANTPRQDAIAAPDVAELVEALERIRAMDSMSYHSLESAKIVAHAALSAYRKKRGGVIHRE